MSSEHDIIYIRPVEQAGLLTIKLDTEELDDKEDDKEDDKAAAGVTAYDITILEVVKLMRTSDEQLRGWNSSKDER